MAVAPFFAKAALSASQIMSGVTQTDFLARVSKARVIVMFADDAAASTAGRTTVEMTVNLLARLLPGFALVAYGREAESYRARLQELALAINPLLELQSGPVNGHEPETFAILLGKAPGESVAQKIYVGADGWTADLSTRKCQSFGSSPFPFGAAAAGCIAVANVFRHIFRDVLESAALDENLTLSLYRYDQPGGPEVFPQNLGEMHLVGAGAIGNAVVWTLGRMKELHGILHIIDPEDVELSNLQRYVLTSFTSPGQSKVEIARSFLSATDLLVQAHATSWGQYLAQRGDYRLDLVAVGLDSARDRIEVQGCLPRRIVNAWTQRENLGVSRHFQFGHEPCLACLYIPDGPVPNEDEEILRSLKLPLEDLMRIREMLHLGTPLTRDFIIRIAQLSNKTPEVLEPFVGQPLRALYSGAVCGGLLLDLNGPAMPAADVPMPFQSALAGVMLAAEMCLSQAARLHPTTTTINLLRPIPPYLSFPRARHEQCLCRDRLFLATYEKKWSLSNGDTKLPI